MLVDDLLGLGGKTAVVLGGGQGIGEAVCRLFAQAGCNVGVIDVDPARAGEVAKAVAALGPNSLAMVVDILDDAALAAAVESCDAHFGGVDVLVAVVGQALFSPALEMSLADWDLDHRRNLRYVFAASQAFARLRVRRGEPGAVVALASVSGLQSAANHASYGAAKAGLVNLVRSLADEWAVHAIRVNAVAPGAIVTPRRPDTAEWRERVSQSPLPMKRRGEPADIAKAVLFLASQMSPYVTGETLTVDGGWMAANIMRRAG